MRSARVHYNNIEQVFDVDYLDGARYAGRGKFPNSTLLAEAVETWLVDNEIVGEKV